MLLAAVVACSSNQYATTNRFYKRQAKDLAREIRKVPNDGTAGNWVGTTNFGLRKPEYVVIHHTAQNSCDQTLKTFTLPRTQVSAHYVICRDGRVYHMLNDYLRAWHGGIGSWGNSRDINSSSIGIELDNNGFEPFPEAQIQSLLVLLDTLKGRYRIPVNNFIGHADIAPRRKNDPNVQFPWNTLAEKGFGIWHRDTTYTRVPEHFDKLQALRIIGYSVQDSAAALKAFKRRFLGVEDTMALTGGQEKILYDLMLQNM